MKPGELRGLSPDELQRRLGETQKELFNLRFQKATLQLKRTSELRRVRKDMARMNTIIRERELS